MPSPVLILVVLVLLVAIGVALYYALRPSDDNGGDKSTTCKIQTDCGTQACISGKCADCTTSPQCGTGMECKAGKCSAAPCTDTSCPSGSYCSDSKTCLLTGTCGGDADCDTNLAQVCSGSVCKAKSCSDSLPCPTGFMCKSGSCVKSCTDNTQCGGLKCALTGDNAGQCVQCIDGDSTCGSGNKCTNNTCISNKTLNYTLNLGNPDASSVNNIYEVACTDPGTYVEELFMRSDATYGITSFGIRCNNDKNPNDGGSKGMQGASTMGTMHHGTCLDGFSKFTYRNSDADTYLKYFTPYCVSGNRSADWPSSCCGGSGLGPSRTVDCPAGQILKGVKVGVGPASGHSAMVTKLQMACAEK